MLQPMIRRARPGLARDITASVPAPIGGWNVRDPLSAMPQQDAVVMDNWFPEAHEVRLRPGCSGYLPTADPGPFTLMPWNGPAGQKLLACIPFGSSTQFLIGDTSGGTFTALSGFLTSNDYSYTNFTTSGGHFLVAVNGAEDLQLYNGTTLQSINSVSVPAITGVPTNELTFVTQLKRRLWFARKDSSSAWYLPVDAVAGAAVEFPLGAIFKRGGYLVAMGSWSVDGGDGVDDHSIFISSEGEIAIYTGTDPSSASDFFLIGLFYVGEPIGRRCLAQFGGDLLYLCRYGVYPLSKALTSSTIDRRQAITDKINVAFASAVAAYGALPGWQVIVYPGGPFVLVNIPIDELAFTSMQFVMNTLTGAWCRFTGLNAYHWEVFDDLLYSGGIGPGTAGDINGIQLQWSGVADNDLPIAGNCQQAFNYFGRRGQQKLCKLIRPMLALDATIGLQLSLDTDFSVNDFASTSSLAPPAGFLWDIAVWDVATWSAGARVLRNWASVPAREFYAAALRLQVSSASATVRWTATDFALEVGGIL